MSDSREKNHSRGGGRTLLENRRQAMKARVLTWSFTVGALSSLAWLAACSCENAAIVASLTVLVALGLQFYLTRYVVWLAVDREALTLQTAALGSSPLRIPLARFVRAQEHEGKARYAGAPSVDAPWISLRLAGYRVPFVLDAKSEVCETRAILHLRAPRR